MSRPSQLPHVVDALITAFTAGVPGVSVLDGPSLIGDDLPELIIVGDEGDEGDSDSSFVQAWAGLGAQSKDEEGSVACAVITQAGDDDQRTRRLRAFEILGLCETAQRADLSLGGIVLFSAIEAGTYRPISNDRGTAARVGFTITYKARI
jgi:hypothetical protein